MIFKAVYQKGKKFLVKIVFPKEGDKWCTTTSAVYNFAKRTFSDGDEVNVEYEVKNGQYFVSRITKGDGAMQDDGPEPEASQANDGPVCEDCGVSLKDGKYKKCYNCNQKTKRTQSKPTGPTCEDCGKTLKDSKYQKCYECNQKAREESKTTSGTEKKSYYQKDTESIRKQCVLKASVECVKVLTGQVGEIAAIGDMVETLYKRFYKLIN